MRGWKEKFVPQWGSEEAETITVSRYVEERRRRRRKQSLNSSGLETGVLDGGGSCELQPLTDNQMTNPHPSHQWHSHARCTSLYSCMVGVSNALKQTHTAAFGAVIYVH